VKTVNFSEGEMSASCISCCISCCMLFI